ncbi:MAG TPA: hypothetical protein VM285_09110, partial [Polyangia bacterium]|nr:hypothetical protein [Polyangia bacterium]
AAVKGTLVAGGRTARLSGLGYLESIRWLRSPLAGPARWFWGYLHSGAYTVLFFEPEDYPGARSLLLFSKGAKCVTAVEDAGLRVTPPAAGNPEVGVKFDGDGLSLSLTIDSGAKAHGGFPIFLAPYRLELRHGGKSHTASGAMVFEIGQWRSF